MASPLKKLKVDGSPGLENSLPLSSETRDKMKYYRKVSNFNGWNSLRHQSKNCYSLEHFGMDCTFQNPNHLNKFLKVQKTLTSLDLPIFSDLRKGLMKRLPTLKCLRKFEISLPPKIKDKELTKFATELKTSLPRIQEFYLNFVKCHEIGNDGLQALAFHLGKNFRKNGTMQLLYFNIENSFFIRDDGVLFLADQIGKNTNTLQHFIFRVSDCEEISASVFETFVQRIGNSKTIKTLTLERTFAEDLEEFDIIFDTGFRRLVNQIGENLQNLTHLSLTFKHNIVITNSGMQELAAQIGKNLKALERLQLDFENSSTVVDDEGLQMLIKAIEDHLPMLKSITLDFSRYDNLTDESIKSLSKLIGSLAMIEEVNLYFDDCSQITTKGKKILKRLNRI